MHFLNNRILCNFVKCCRGYGLARRIKRVATITTNNLSYCSHSTTFSTSIRLSSTINRNKLTNFGSDNSDKDEIDDVFDDSYKELVQRTFRTPDMGHQVFVIQPYIKWGPSKRRLTTPDYQLAESVALIETLDDWKVVAKEKISLESFKKSKFFGKGNLELLQEKINSNNLVSAVFISVNRLTYVQQEFLEETFGVPVYDRYSIVIQIFHKHAVTKEAKLQVAMAEIPFMWYSIKSSDDKGTGGISYTGGSGETFLELKKRILTDKEQKIKRELKKLESHRSLIRNKRKKKEFPVIAVVGYTNAGKTSLIKGLTEEENLRPRNQLFATLDVTVHEGYLPSNLKVLYVDTIGFISDIPTELIEPFTVTLEDAVQSDVLIHVMDVSNPDIVSQANHVIDTLHRLKLDNKLITNVINVANKCDIISDNVGVQNILKGFDENPFLKNIIQVSCLKNTGLNELSKKIESVLLKLTGRIQIKIRVRSGGPEFSWLYKESCVVRVVTDDKDAQLVYMDVIITETSLMKFKHLFINSKQYQNG